MKTEIEVKFFSVDIDEMRQRLTDAGAVLRQPMRLMKRAIIEEPHHTEDKSFIRVRDEGDKTTLTFKRRSDLTDPTIHNTKEIEVTVSDFADTVELLREAGWSYKTFQESKRETWALDSAEVVIDEWPWIQPYIEIEAATEDAVKSAAKKLGLLWSDAKFGHIDAIYEQKYEFLNGVRGVIDIKEVRFGDPVPNDFKAREGNGL